MRIVILRHGEPTLNLSELLKTRCTPYELKAIFEEYGKCGLHATAKPPPVALRMAQSCNTVICSNLPRSIESAEALGVEELDLIDPVFREADMPHTEWLQPKLSIFTWGIIFRTLWFLGYSNKADSVSSVKNRAKLATEELIKMAVNHGSVLLIGHGIFNRFLAKELINNGWHGPKNPGYAYWGFGVYKLDNPTTS